MWNWQDPAVIKETFIAWHRSEGTKLFAKPTGETDSFFASDGPDDLEFDDHDDLDDIPGATSSLLQVVLDAMCSCVLSIAPDVTE